MTHKPSIHEQDQSEQSAGQAPQSHQRKRALPTIDKATIDRLRDDGLSYRAIAERLDTNYARVYRAAHPTSRNGDRPETALQRVAIVGEPVSTDDNAPAPSQQDGISALATRLDALVAEVAALRAHRLEVDAWIATLQAQSRDTAQPSAEVRSAARRGIGQGSAEDAQTWDDPDDAKAVPFNLSLPRGLKRLLDAEAKRTGLPAGRLVHRLLMAALVEGER